MSHMRLFAALTGDRLDLSPELIADSLWLAAHMRRRVVPKPSDALAPPLTVPTPPPPGPTPATPTRQTGPTSKISPPQTHPAAQPAVDIAAAAPASTGAAAPPLQVSSGPALPGQLAISRALRPLMQRVPSRTLVTIDEMATAVQIAETDLWVPVLRPQPERWLDLALVIDQTPSLRIWQQTITELEQLLARMGAFRRIRIWSLVSDQGGALRLRPRHASVQPRIVDPKMLRVPDGRQIVLLVTDGSGPAWRSGQMISQLHSWGGHQVVAVLNMLPDWLWRRTTLGFFTSGAVINGTPGAPTRAYRSTSPDASPQRDSSSIWHLPVITLDHEVLRRWAGVVVGKDDTTAPTLRVHDQPLPRATRQQVEPGQRVERFLAIASEEATMLAALLSVIRPVTLPIARLVQNTFSAHAQQTHLAEVILSGLLEPENPQEGSPHDEENVRFEFLPGVREQLKVAAPIPERLRMLRRVGTYLSRCHGLGQQNFLAWARPADISSHQDLINFARLAASDMRGLGGTYAQFIERVEVPQELPNEHELRPASPDDGKEAAIDQVSPTHKFRRRLSRYPTLEMSITPSAEGFVLTLHLVGSVGNVRHGPFAMTFDPRELLASWLDPMAYGAALRAAVFAGEAGIAFRECYAATSGSGQKLRVQLLLPHNLQSLYWETLLAPAHDRPLACEGDLLLSRYLSGDGFQPVRPRPKGELCALIAVAAPTSDVKYKLAKIVAEEEIAQVVSAMGSVRHNILGTAGGRLSTWQHISDTLREGCDILYLVAHGKLIAGKPILYLVDNDNNVAPFHGAKLAGLLRSLDDRRRPRMVILGSCESAGDGYSDALAALGPMIVQAGVPAVLAMQGSFSAASNRRFANVFFRELLRDGDIDHAVNAARRAIQEQDYPDWWMPVLYTSLTQGVLWMEDAQVLPALSAQTNPLPGSQQMPNMSPSSHNEGVISPLDRTTSTRSGDNMRGEQPKELVNAARLRELLIAHFNESEMRTLCFDIKIDYESLSGQANSDKARELVAHVRRHGQIALLLTECQKIRQHVDWESVVVQTALPKTVIHFTNRKEEIWRIMEMADPRLMRPIYISAPAGFGKSALLQEMVDRFADKNYDCALVKVNHHTSIDLLIDKLSTQLGLRPDRIVQSASIKMTPGELLISRWIRRYEDRPLAETPLTGLVILIDFDDIPTKSLTDDLAGPFINACWDNLKDLSNPPHVLLIMAGRALETLDLPSNPEIMVLTLFTYKSVKEMTQLYFPRRRKADLAKAAAHVLYLTGGHPGCMAELLKQFGQQGLAADRYFTPESGNQLWNTVVRFAVDDFERELKAKLPNLYHVVEALCVFRYADDDILQAHCNAYHPQGHLDGEGLSDSLTQSYLFTRRSIYISDGIGRQLVTIKLRYENPDHLRALCSSAADMCLQRIKDGIEPQMWALEYLFQRLQAMTTMRLERAADRREALLVYLHTEIPLVVKAIYEIHPRWRDFRDLILLIDEKLTDERSPQYGFWEFIFLFNYLFRAEEYDNTPIKLLRKALLAERDHNKPTTMNKG